MQSNQNCLEDWLEERLIRKRTDQNSGFDLLSKLTIIIVSYGRQTFLLRQAVYWGYSRANIIIVDGSPNPLTDKVCNILAGLPNILYLHAKDDIVNRLKLAAKYIQTPYVVSLSDDEFFLKGALCKVIALLDEDDELVACNGQVVDFDYSRPSGGASYHKSSYPFFGYAILEGNARDRLAHAMGSYNAATCYAVLRRDVWVDSWGSMQVWSSAHTIEPYQAIATYLHGKLTTVDDIYMLSSSEHPTMGSVQNTNKKISFQEWWFTPRYASEREEFVSRLAGIAMNCSGLCNEKSRKIVEDAVTDYFAFCEAKKKGALFRSIRNDTRATISKVLRRIMSPSAFQMLKQRVKKLVGGKSHSGDSENMDRWPLAVKSGDAVNCQSEIQGIEKLVLEFYEALAKSKVMQ